MTARRIDSAREVKAARGSTLVAIGNYDGVHRGHQAVIGAGVERATALGLDPLVLTFHPHPHEVLGRQTRQVLTTIERKVQLLAQIDERLRIVVEPFTMKLASLDPEAFARDVLVEQLGAREVLVGENFRFGAGRAGDLELLRKIGQDHGFDAYAEPLHGDELGAFSSSRVRAAVLAGDLAHAEHVLGRPHALCGTVMPGDGRGRELGFPTANLDGVAETLPPDGVYAVLVDRVDGDDSLLQAHGVANLGVRPTADAGRSIEVHLIDRSEKLYGRKLCVHLMSRLRDERRFANLEVLAAQIARDIEQARSLLTSRSSARG